MRIILTGGGTGGHLIPFEPIIESLRAYYLEAKQQEAELPDSAPLTLYFVGIADKKTVAWFAKYDVKATHVSSGKLRRYASHLTIFDLFFRLPFGILKALFVIWKIMPDVVISKGGYGSLPTVIAAAFYRIPILSHESDAISGLANQFSARLSTAITVGFQETKEEMKKFQYKTFVTGTPVRHQFGLTTMALAKQHFGFQPTDKVVLIMGGSQGAAQLNEIILQVLPRLITQVGIIHLTGENHFTKISTVANELINTSARKEYYKPFPYLTDTMNEAMSAANVIVSRAGATTLAEIAHLQKPCLLIPLESAANDHQRRNAQIYERHGAARVLEPANLSRNLFERSLLDLVENDALQQEMTRNLAILDHPQAAREIAELTFKLANGLLPTSKSAA